MGGSWLVGGLYCPLGSLEGVEKQDVGKAGPVTAVCSDQLHAELSALVVIWVTTLPQTRFIGNSVSYHKSRIWFRSALYRPG
jgi:hypothetical protein